MSATMPDAIFDMFFAKEKCFVCGEEFDSLMCEHPPFDEHHKEQARLRGEQRAAELQERQSKRKPWNELSDPYWQFISKECPDLEAAKVFVQRWYKGTHELSTEGQAIDVPNGGSLCCAMRAMAGMVSRVLEGYDEDPDGFIGDYFRTEYGIELYQSMCS